MIEAKQIKEKAKEFAIKAHKGQIRKSEPDKPKIIHPMMVARLLEDYDYDDELVAAAYLHDIVEDTNNTILDIKSEFGDNIANLVMSASEPDKSLSWEERKLHTIEETKKMPLRNKLLICADKINNLEDLMILFQKTGNRNFSAFKRGEEKQKWYYTNIYESLIYNEDKTLPIFERLKSAIDIVFNNQKNLFLENIIFQDNKDYYKSLQKLHACKLELERIKSITTLDKPFVIEFTGTPRTGKTTIINNLYDFFKKGGFIVDLIEEFTTSKYYKEIFREKIKDLSISDRNIRILEETYKRLIESISSNNDIILVDRGINDRQIWNYLIYKSGDIPREKYFEIRDQYLKLSRKYTDILIATYASPTTSLKRDYQNSLSLEQRSFLNLDNIKDYNESLLYLKSFFESTIENFYIINTEENSPVSTAVQICDQILPVMRKKYIKSIKNKYNL